jgi:hypothetical protein
MAHHPCMAVDPDPYRTLGLARSATLDEVKRAYRRLAKEHHPDAAGEAALPRFLAIQAAYDQIVGPGASAAAAGRRPRRPWEADPFRADATRRAYGDRGRRTRPGAAGTRPPGARTERPSGTGPDAASDRRADEPADGRPKRATLGSTSYDGADNEPFEPDWGGASWYGTTSGTYWTLNPKEYADPRKHGPEYQARGRRAREEAGGSGAAGDHGGAPGADDPGAPFAGGTSPSHTTTSWWDEPVGTTTAADPTAADPPTTAWTAAASRSGPAARSDGATTDTASDGPESDRLTEWLDPGRLGLAGRVGAAAIGWVPIALGIGWIAGEVTGCGRFAATCDAGTAPIAWFAQVTVLALLLIVPGLARAATVAAVATLAAAVAGALLLSATGGAEGGDAAFGRTALGGLLVIAWVCGFGLAIARELRGPGRPPTPAGGTGGPVS